MNNEKNINNKKKKARSTLKSKLPYIIGVVIGLIIGLIIGFISASNTEKDINGDSSSLFLEMLPILLMIVSSWFGIILHIILHETGHLICGFLSGYKFVSFSVGNIMLIKENGKLKTKKFGIPGAGGQCLMSPPEPINNTYPFAMYYLGGSLMNFVITSLFLTLFLFLKNAFPYAGVVFISIAIIGVLLGLLNILPIKSSGLATDGYNIVSLKKSEQTRRANWLLLTMNARISSGERAKNLPAEWFEFPENYNFNDAISANVAAMGLSCLIDRHDFIAAKELAEKILINGEHLIELLKNEVRCECLFLEIIGEHCQERQDNIERIFTPELEKYIKASKTQLSKHRLMYAYEKLVSFNDDKAKNVLTIFNKICNVYPYAGDRESEWELIGIIDDLNVKDYRN